MVWVQILVGSLPGYGAGGDLGGKHIGKVWVQILVGSLPGYGVGGDLGGEPTWVWCGWRSWWETYR